MRNITSALLTMLLLFRSITVAQSLDHLSWGAISNQTSGMPIDVSLAAQDLNGQLVSNFNGSVSLSGWTTSAPPALLISEMDTANARIELLNPGDDYQDVSGWELIFYDSTSWPAPRGNFLLPAPLIVPPGAVLEVRSGGTSPGIYPVFFTGSPSSWTTSGGGGGPAAVLLRTSGGAPADFVCAGSAFAAMISVPAPLTGSDWSGLPLPANGLSTRTYQRIGASDHHNAGDWVITNRTVGSLNQGLNLPFPAGSVGVPVAPAAVTFSDGQWSGSVNVATNDTWIFLRADDLAGHSGDSAWFKIVSGPPLGIQVPGAAYESSAGFAGTGIVSLPFVAPTNVPIALTSSLPGEISVPASVIVLAGQTNASFAITNYDDSQLDGARIATITAQAVGFATASAAMSNIDNEIGVLSWSAPATVSEGNGTLAGATQVRVDVPPTVPFAVTLTSSNANELRVPPQVFIAAGQTSAVVDLTVVDDARIDGPQAVVLHASVPGWIPADTTVVVADNESTNLTLALATPVWEGSGAVSNAGSLRISGTLNSDLTVALSSDLPARLTVPSAVVIPAGQTSIVVSVTVPDDGTNDFKHFVQVSAQAPGFVPATNVVTVRDNDVDHFTISGIAGAQLAGANVAVTIQALNRDGELLSPFNGFAALLANDGSGPITVTPSSIGPFTNGTWSGSFQIPAETTGVIVTVTDGAGHIGTSGGFDVVAGTLLDLPISDLAFDATRGKLWAAVKSGAVAGAQSVMEINPATGAFGTIVPLGTEPGKLAISDDGQFLYAALTSTGGVARVNLSSSAVDMRFALGLAGTTALQLGVPPGDAHGLIVQMANGDSGTALFRDGVRKPNIVAPPNFVTEHYFDFYASTSNFFYINGGGMFWLNANSSGLSIVRGAANPPYAGPSVPANGLLFFPAGAVVEPGDLRLLGTYPTNGLVAPDANAGQVFFLSGNRLRTFDLPGFLDLASTALPISGSDSFKLLRCGSNFLAVGTTGGKLLLIRSKNVRQPAAADLSVTQSVSAAFAVIQSNLTCSIIVSNAGPGIATNVVLVDVLPVDSALISSVSSQGTCLFTNGILSCAMGSLSAGGFATVQFTVQPATPGPLRNLCWVTGDGINPANGSSVLESRAVFGPVFPAVTRLRINSTALVYDSARNALWTGSERFANAIDHSLRSISLSNGLPQTAIPLGYLTGKIALSADQSYLYAAYANDQDGLNYTPDNYLARANLTANTIDQTIPVVDMFNQQHAVVDMIGISSFPSGVVVARSGPQNDIALYQNGAVIRRSPTDTGPGKLEVNPTIPTRFYRLIGGYGGGNVLQLDIGASAINLLSSGNVFSIPPSPVNPSASDMRYAAGQLFSDIGIVADAEGLVRTAEMPVAGLVQPDAAASLVFYLVASGTNQILTAFDINTFLPAWSFIIPGVTGAPASLIKCGSGLLAFRTSEDELFVLNPSLLPHALQTDLALTETANAASATTNTPVTFTAVVWNNGPCPATGVMITNRLPAGAIVTGITSSQGSVSNVGNVITANLGNLPMGTFGVLQVVATLSDAGVLTNLAAVTGSVPDSIASNNLASVEVPFSIVPNADVGVSQVIIDGLPGTVGSNVTYSILFTNRGPNVAANAYLIDTFEPGSLVVTAQVSQGTVSWDSGQAIAQFGDVTNGAAAVLTLVLRPAYAGITLNTAVVGSSLTDTVPANNQSVYSVQVVSTSAPETIREFRLRATDIAYDPTTGQIRAGVMNDEPGLSNSVVQLHPVTGQLSHQVFVGEPFGMILISDDAQYLYLARSVTGGVSRILLPADTVDLSFGLYPPDPPRFCFVNDMKVLPGQAHSLAASVSQGQIDVGVWIYDDGVPRTNAGPGNIYGGNHPIAFGATSNVLYETFPYIFRTLAADASGVQFVSDTNNLVPAYDTAFEFDAGRVYFRSGRVVDPVAGTILGQIPITGLVAPDTANGRVYFATTTGVAPFNYQITVRSFDATTFAEQWAVRLPVATGAGTRLIRLGTNGLAVATDAGRVFVVRAPGNPAAEVSLQKSFSQTLVSTGQTFTATLTLQNNGPWTATGVTVNDSLPAGFALVSATIPGGSYIVSNNVVICSFGSLNNGATVAATLQLTASDPGTFTNSATVSSVEPDSNPANNTASAAITVTPVPSLSAPDVLVREGDIIGSVLVPVYLSGMSGNTVSVQYQTLNGTALAGQDYNAASGSLNFSPGVTNRSIFLSGGLRGNTLVESNRYYFLRLTNAVNASLSQTLIKITILDDDYYTFSVSAVSVPEGNSSNSSAVFIVRLLRPAAQPVSVDYRTFGVTAVPGEDFQPRSGTLWFAPGVTNLSVPVSIFGDTVFEPDETFRFDLANPTLAVLAVNAVSGTILNDDAFPPFAITAIVRAAGTVRLRFESSVGSTYRLERSQTLQSDDWTIVADQIIGTGSEVEIDDPGSSGADRAFYRVRRLP